MLPFSGQFPPDCQRTSLPTSLKFLVTNLLYGSSERVQDDPKEQTSLFATGSHVICKGSHTGSMGVSDHEEADTRMCIHIQDAMQKGAKKILLRTVDTDVIVILAGNFFFTINISRFRYLGCFWHWKDY